MVQEIYISHGLQSLWRGLLTIDEKKLLVHIYWDKTLALIG